MSVRRVVLIACVVNLIFLAALGGAYWSQSARAQGGAQPQPEAPEAQILGIVSEYMNYQGMVRDGAGDPVQGNHDLTFTLYSCSGGAIPACTAQWSDTYALDLLGGVFNARLGPLDPKLFEPRTLVTGWHLEVGVRVDGGTELSPRVKLNTTVPWAFTSRYTESMPEPQYDSGWITDPACTYPTLTHNLDGNIDDYVVKLECRHPDYGTYNCMRTGGIDAYWYNLSSTSIQVNSCGNVHAEYFRVLIWVTR